MTDQQIEKVLAEGLPLAAVLLVRGGWLSSKESVELQTAFEATEKSPALWKVLLGESHAVYVEASSILGISVERYRDQLHPDGAVADQALGGAPGQGPGFADAGEG